MRSMFRRIESEMIERVRAQAGTPTTRERIEIRNAALHETKLRRIERARERRRLAELARAERGDA